MFPTICFVACQILSIVGKQIETTFFLFFSGHIYKPKKISFTITKLKNFDFCERKLAK
jgi:hypothetical protein